jgi:hypothetical protein
VFTTLSSNNATEDGGVVRRGRLRRALKGRLLRDYVLVGPNSADPALPADWTVPPEQRGPD